MEKDLVWKISIDPKKEYECFECEQPLDVKNGLQIQDGQLVCKKCYDSRSYSDK